MITRDKEVKENMKITKIVINNFRLLKTTEIDLEKELSLIIGKNNCGKTSILTVLTKFLGEQSTTNNFNYDDFNIDFPNELFQCVDKNVGTWRGRTCQGIELYVFIQYDDADNLANISSLMLDLDPDNKMVVLKLGYILDDTTVLMLRESFEKYS